MLLESRSLVRRFSFGDLVLLQPELLDAYASAVINAASADPDGLGTLKEAYLFDMRLPIPQETRVSDSRMERALLFATLEEILKYDLALREYGAEGPLLIFPSQFAQETLEAPRLELRPSLIFSFSGPIMNIYAGIAVRLAQSGIFTKTGMWRYGVLYSSDGDGCCRLQLRNAGEGSAELEISYAPETSRHVRRQFEEYVYVQLIRRAVRDSVVTALPS